MNLMDDKALKDRIYDVYYRMKVRARPRKWKTGKHAGKLRKAGLDGLPFTREQLWGKAVETIGPTGITNCPYCEAIGKPANLIDLRNIVFDHYVPTVHGGTWDLDNIRGCCEDCNRLKGSMSFPFFVAIMAAVEKWPDPRDRSYFHACLRTHGVSNRMRFPAKAKEKSSSAPPLLPLTENF